MESSSTPHPVCIHHSGSEDEGLLVPSRCGPGCGVLSYQTPFYLDASHVGDVLPCLSPDIPIFPNVSEGDSEQLQGSVMEELP